MKLRVNIHQLATLVSIADYGNFSAAADFLGTVQSNVSSHIAKLEKDLDVILYDRATGQLTDAGRLVATRARRVLAEIDALDSDIAALKSEVSGSVKIGTIGTTARWLCPRLMDIAAKKHPKLRLVILEGTTTTLEPRVATGQLDLAICNIPLAARDLVTQPLFLEELVLVVPVDHPLAQNNRIPLSALANMELLLPMEGTAFRGEIDEAITPLGIQLHPRAEIDGTRLIASLTFEGYGPSILPATAIPSYLRDRWALVHVDGLPCRQVGIAMRSRGFPSAPARAALELLRDIVANPSELPEGLSPISSS
ncbi:MAG: LysR family transcriptional regulator [Actinobacteria bacterium]|jgi:DNA-binding transcriptional LysR family regulator|nr:LysR family transcriptional regulator [Actinomycetota bacterium]